MFLFPAFSEFFVFVSADIALTLDETPQQEKRLAAGKIMSNFYKKRESRLH